MDNENSDHSEPIQSSSPRVGQVLRVALGARQYALRSSEVVRVLPMCAWTPLYGTDGAGGPLGLVEIAGTLHPVMDPRPRLGLERVDIALEHHLLLIDAQPAFVLWVDGVEEVFETVQSEVQRLEVFEGSPVCFLVRHQGETLPLLESGYFSPGEFVRPA